MTHESNDWNNSMQSQIDRLVAAELPDEQRRVLFDWCNANPIRWRQCALAFLEAQTWHQGLADWTAESISSDSVPIVTTVAVSTRPRNEHMQGWRTWGVLAASLLISFFAGLLVRDPMLPSRLLPDGSANPNSKPVAGVRHDGTATAVVNSPTIIPFTLQPTYVTVSVRTNLNPDVPGKLQIPVTTPDDLALTATGKREMPDYVRKQWEKRGYQVAQIERYLNAKLPDGRDVVVPVNGLEVKFVGKPVY